MRNKLDKKENNLFQSQVWLSFQEKYGRKTIKVNNCTGLIIDIPLGKKFIWVQKGTILLSIDKIKLPSDMKDVVFIRLEPEKMTEADVFKYSLKKVEAGSLLSGQSSPRATQILDISKSEEEILTGMKQKTRYNIRLAEKKGVQVKIIDDVDVFYDLLLATAGRDRGYFPHEKEYYLKMIEELGGSDNVHIFVAEKDGEYLAAIMASFFGEIATYLHGGFSEGHRNLMAPYLCQWEAMKYARKKKCMVYDFWGVAENDDPSDPWAGITRFKEGFGGEKVIFPGSYDLVINKFWYNLLTYVAKIRHLIKK